MQKLSTLHTDCSMRTRSQAHQAICHVGAADAAFLPLEVQTQVLDALLTHFAKPDAMEYQMFPYKSTHCWLCCLCRVNKAWHDHITGTAAYTRRRRLEQLRTTLLLHDHAHLMLDRICSLSKQARLKAVPSRLLLHFHQDSQLQVTVCRSVTPPMLSKADTSTAKTTN